MINTVSKGLLLNLCVKIAHKIVLEYVGVYWTNSYVQLIWWIQWDWDFISCEINGSEVLLFGSNHCKRGHSHTLLLVKETIFSGQWGWSSGTPSLRWWGRTGHTRLLLLISASRSCPASGSLCLSQWEKTLGSAGHEHLEKAFLFGSLLFYPATSNFCVFFATATEVCSWHGRGTGMQSALLQNSV